jgi:Tat protein translocase TatB subunit
MLEFGGFIEFFIIAVAALLLLGPKELPVVLRFLGKWIYKIKRATSGFKNYIDHHLETGEIEAFTEHSFNQAKHLDSDKKKS